MSPLPKYDLWELDVSKLSSLQQPFWYSIIISINSFPKYIPTYEWSSSMCHTPILNVSQLCPKGSKPTIFFTFFNLFQERERKKRGPFFFWVFIRFKSKMMSLKPHESKTYAYPQHPIASFPRLTASLEHRSSSIPIHNRIFSQFVVNSPKHPPLTPTISPSSHQTHGQFRHHNTRHHSSHVPNSEKPPLQIPKTPFHNIRKFKNWG